MTATPVLSGVFRQCAANDRAAFIPFLMAGDPDIRISRQCIAAAADSGADIVEIGIPYSDPVADGPTIQRASQRARNAGTTFDSALSLAHDCAARYPSIAFIGFTYFNPVFVRGIKQTAHDFASAGLRGIIVPDLPFGEAHELLAEFNQSELSVTFLIAPTTPLQRAVVVAAQCSDFVYVVSRMGITGAAGGVGTSLKQRIRELRSITDKPLAVGFGVDSAATAALVARHADGVIVGSSLIDGVQAAGSPQEAVSALRTACTAFAKACQRQHASVAGAKN